MVVQAYLFLVKKLKPAPEPAEEIQITSVASASPAAPVPESRDSNLATPPGDFGFSRDPTESLQPIPQNTTSNQSPATSSGL